VAARENISPQQFRSVYHGTDSEAWEQIQQSGLNPSTTAPSSKTVAAKPGYVRSYAASAPSWNDRPDARPVVVAARIPSRVFHGYVDTSDPGPYDLYSLRRTIPPKYLKERK
jgi:hypothetical protein